MGVLQFEMSGFDDVWGESDSSLAFITHELIESTSTVEFPYPTHQVHQNHQQQLQMGAKRESIDLFSNLAASEIPGEDFAPLLFEQEFHKGSSFNSTSVKEETHSATTVEDTFEHKEYQFEDTPSFDGTVNADSDQEKNWIEFRNPYVSLGDNSSLDLFLSFCRYFVDGTNPNNIVVDVKGVFSRTCFEQWLRTRQKLLKKPEESFRKTVTAHTQGTDGRKPFPPEVEKFILVELRRQSVWPCFQGYNTPSGEKINIGLQGFRGKGHHEERGRFVMEPSIVRAAQEAVSSRLLNGAKPKTEEHHFVRRPSNSAQAANVWKRKRVSHETSVEDQMQQQIMFNMNEWRKNPHVVRLTVEKLRVLPTELFGENKEFGDIFDSEDISRVLEVLGSNVKPKTIRAAALVVMTRFFQPHQFLSLMSVTSVMNKEEIFQEEILNLDLSIKDPRFDPKFLLPEDEFVPGLPIAQNIFCMNTYMYISCDKVSKEIMEGNAQGSLPQQFVHPLQFWMILLHVIPRLMQKGELMWQSYSCTCRGRRIITRTRYKVVGSTIQTSFQDVTHMYPDIMALPSFDEIIDDFLSRK